MSTRVKVLLTALTALLMASTAVVWALTRPASQVEVDPSADLRTPGMVVRDTDTGRLAVVRPDGSRAQTPVSCARVYSTAKRAVCLRAEESAPGTFALDVLNPDLTVLQTLPINGVPTRARLSADGRMVAWTVFVAGDSYTSSGFSTRSGILDTETGVLDSSLEDFRLVDSEGKGGPPPKDTNFWGVSFAVDDNTFYATMSTGSHLYLVQGDATAETVSVLADGVECPSLSPDGTRLVYKRRLPDLTWRLEVYALGSGHRTALAGAGNVDDQGTWLDDRTIAYGQVNPDSGRSAVWSVLADGSGQPTLLADGAESPSPPTAS